MPKLSEQTEKLISRYEQWHQSQRLGESAPTIHVDEVASRVAAFYEKIREVVDWKEEHLMRRAAISRMVKRRLILGEENQGMAESLIMELIRGGHFPNDRIEEKKILEVQRIIDKYKFILQNVPKAPREKLKLQLYNWLLEIAACEIEETLSPPAKEEALIDYMTELMQQRIKPSEGILVIGGFSEQEKNTQIYIAVQRALFNLDSPIISYNLIKKRFPNWVELSVPAAEELAKNIYNLWDSIEKDLNHPLSDKFYKICERYDTPYLLLGDVLSQAPVKEKISQPAVLEGLIKGAYKVRLKTLKSRVSRAAIYATLSIFLTNIVSLLAVEIPFTKYVTGGFNFWAIGVDILGPTFLMAFLVITIRPPKRENLTQVIIESMKIVYKKDKTDIYQLKIRKKRGAIFNFLTILFYFLSFCFTVSLIVWGLSKVNFPALSYLIFVIFISLIAFAGAKIRERAKELHVIEIKEGVISFALDLFAVPIIHLGRWLSIRWKKYNVISVFFSALVDMPFLLFVEFLEQWRYFLREKKEKIH